MRVLIATDAWHPQINGVVRTLESLAESVGGLGSSVTSPHSGGVPSVPLPTYPGLRCALPKPSEPRARIEQARPDAIHIATEGPSASWSGAIAWRGACLSPPASRPGSPNTSPRACHFPSPGATRRCADFHSRRRSTMVSTHSLMAELAGRGFTTAQDVEPRRGHRAVPARTGDWSGISAPDIHVRRPHRPGEEPGGVPVAGAAWSKVVIGHGPQEAELRAPFPGCRRFLGALSGENLAAACRGCRRVRVSEQDGHVRHRPARGAGERRARCRLSGDGAQGRDRRCAGGHARQRPRRACLAALGMSRAGLPRTCAAVLVGQRAPPIPRSCELCCDVRIRARQSARGVEPEAGAVLEVSGLRLANGLSRI